MADGAEHSCDLEGMVVGTVARAKLGGASDFSGV